MANHYKVLAMKQRFAWYNDSKFIINQVIKLHQISHFSLGLTSKLTAKPRENREQ